MLLRATTSALARGARVPTTTLGRRNPLSTSATPPTPPPPSAPKPEAAAAKEAAAAATEAVKTTVTEAYSKALSLMHWLVAPAFIGSIGAVLQAQQVKGKEKGVWMHRHKSLGLLAGILVAPRFLARLSSQIPGPLEGTNALQHFASKATHAAMYGFMALMPATGIAMGYYGGKGLPFFWTTIEGAATANGEVAKQAFSIHKTLGVYGKYLVPLHIGAAGLHLAKGQAIFARINPFR